MNAPHRYDRLSNAGKKIARIPRFNRLMSHLPPERFDRLTGEAATYWEVYSYVANPSSMTGSQGQTGLIDSGLSRGGEKLGWRLETPVQRELAKIRRWQCQLAMYLLGAIAFEMFIGKSRDGKTPPRFVIDDIDLFLSQTLDRIDRDDTGYVNSVGRRLDLERIDCDWECLKQMNSRGLEHNLLSETTERIFFADITTQTFFAAYWVARWSNAEDREIVQRWLPDPLGLKQVESVAQESEDSRKALQERYDEFWRLMVEMPSLQSDTQTFVACDLARWQVLFAPLYDGTFCDDQSLPIRSTELIYHTWDSMRGTPAFETFQHQFAKLRQNKHPVALGLLSEASFDKNFRLLADRDQPQDSLDKGEFMMGCPVTECPEWDERDGVQDNPKHPVMLSPFRLHRFCVTNEQYELFDGRHRTRREFDDKRNVDSHPVVNVSWFDAWCFSRWLGQWQHEGKWFQIDLPTEAQWEYACRCGETTPFTWAGRKHGEQIQSGDGNFDGNYPWPKGSHSIGKAVNLKRMIRVDGSDDDLTVLANPWGFHQMHGNVWEWCRDSYARDYYQVSPSHDPSGPRVAQRRVLRGGSWFNYGGYCRSGYRLAYDPSYRNGDFGFRLAAVLEPSQPSTQSSSAARGNVGSEGR